MFTFRFQNKCILPSSVRFFTGKTESGFKFKTPTMRMKWVKPVFPPPGENLELPEWTPQFFLKKIGGDCEEFHEQFKDLKEIFSITGRHLREHKKIPCQ